MQKPPPTTVHALMPSVAWELRTFFVCMSILVIRTVSFSLCGLIVNTVQVIPLEKNLGKENTEITDNQREK